MLGVGIAKIQIKNNYHTATLICKTVIKKDEWHYCSKERGLLKI